MIAAHHSLLRAGGVSSLDYVQDGLYYQLDGIENAGRGIHSATATTWTDLTGNGRDGSFINGKTWLDNAVYLAGKSSTDIGKIVGLPSGSSFTFEFVHRVDDRDQYSRAWDTEGYFGGSQPKRFFCLLGDAYDANNISCSIGSNNATNYTLIPVTNTARSFSVVPTPYSSGYSAKISVNGTYVQTVNPAHVYSPQTTTYMDVANRSSNPNRGCDIAVFAIRVYSRVLTAAEISANYAIDKARFNLP